MLKQNAENFMHLGHALYDATVVFDSDSFSTAQEDRGRKLNPEGVEIVQKQFRIMIDLARQLRLVASETVLETCLPEVNRCPQTEAEFKRIIGIFRQELSKKKCLFLLPHLEQHYENSDAVTDEVISKFPNASDEIEKAGTALSVGLTTASVFHSMRAVEIGLRSMNSAFPFTIKGKPLELAEWREMLDALSGVARDIENRPNTDSQKQADSTFVSETSAQFRFFKNGWRVKVAHARAVYDSAQAETVLAHVKSFFELLATRLTELP